MLDASEAPPTFGIDLDRIIGVIARGPAALVTAVEGAEDDTEAGRDDIADLDVRALDSSAFPPPAGRPTTSQLSPKPAARTQPAKAEALLAEHDGFLRPALAADPAADGELPAVPVE